MPNYKYTEHLPQHQYPIRNPSTFSSAELIALERMHFAWLKRTHPDIYRLERDATPEEIKDREYRRKYRDIVQNMKAKRDAP